MPIDRARRSLQTAPKAASKIWWGSRFAFRALSEELLQNWAVVTVQT
mgnify:CR=1 FL=1